jgi:hypothetical protein
MVMCYWKLDLGYTIFRHQSSNLSKVKIPVGPKVWSNRYLFNDALINFNLKQSDIDNISFGPS